MRVTDAISVLVTSLGDFPLDPDSGKAWLWSGAGEHLLWHSATAGAGNGRIDTNASYVNPSAFRGFTGMLERAHPDREPVRVQQLSIGQGKSATIHTCLCRHVPLTHGGYGLLAVAIGAPARSMALVREAVEPAVPAESPAPGLAPHRDGDPSWVARAPEDRSPLRFVWQTDASGQFVHLSRELMDAVGAANSMLLGCNWDAAVARIGIKEAEGIADRLRQQKSWTAPPALWPAGEAKILVPVEMAGLPVIENGHFAGFRGYGIARIEKATKDGGSAMDALRSDMQPTIDSQDDRFGPAVWRILDQDTNIDPAPGTVQPAGPSERLSPAHEGQEPEQSDVPRSIDNSVVAEPGKAASPPAVSPSALTNAERETFREIARSLAAMTSREQEPSAPARPDATAAARRGVRPLEILKQNPISRTSVQPADTAAEPVRSTVSENASPSPVVPFGELQARRNQRSRAAGAPTISLSLLDRLPVGLLVLQQGKAAFANRAFLGMTGYADVESLNVEGRIDQLFDSRLAEMGPDVTSMSIVIRNGERIPVGATIQGTMIDESPATLISMRQQSDYTQLAQNRALELDLLLARAELGELRSVLDTATDGVILLDGQGRILSLNRSAEALFGFDQNEIAGESLTLLLEPESHLAALDYLEGLKSNGVHSIMNDGRDVKGRERNGGAIPLSMTIGRIGDSNDRQKFCAVLRDITHWKKVEADLLDAKRAAEDSSANKTDFLARISHEIRTPLNAVIGFSQVMMNEDFGPIGNDRYKQYARDINASGAHIVSLVNDLLDLSKVASGRLDLNFASVDVNALVAACVDMIQPQANAGKVIVRSQLASQMPPVVADERSVRQILLNLLSNAAKFTEAGGQVVASTTLTERGEVIIRVRDTGIGMAPDDVMHALEPFRQIPGPRASGGTGLGLPLTKALVEANRAGFAIESEPGRGTLVEVTFPATRVLAE